MKLSLDKLFTRTDIDLYAECNEVTAVLTRIEPSNVEPNLQLVNRRGTNVRFNVEKTFLKDERGAARGQNDNLGMVLLQTDATDVGDAVRKIIRREGAELVDEVRWLPGSQAVAAVVKDRRLYMLQFSPDEDGAEDRFYRESPRPSTTNFDDTHREQRR